jgi:sterol 14-demethylase
MKPILRLLPRYTSKPYEFDGYKIPHGWISMVCAELSHKLPEVFADPNRYDPERFSPGRAEDQTPYALIGFGGGVHRCLGMYFAYTEMKVMLSYLVLNFELELVDSGPQSVKGTGFNQPQDPCYVRYRRRR